MLTPEEIQAREFLVSLRGYDRDEVHSFLEQVARQIRDLQWQLESLQGGQPLVHAPEEVPVSEPVLPWPSSADPKPFFEDLGQTTQRIVEAAYESAAEIQRRARGRADRELANARNQAEKLVNEGQRRREVIEGLVEMLEERRAALAEDLRGVNRTVEQMLTDFFAPRGEVAQLTEPDARWALEEDNLAEAELAAAAEESEGARLARPMVGVTESAEAGSENTASHTDDEPPQVSREVRLA